MLYRLLLMRLFQSANVLGVILTLYYRAHGLNYVQILSFEIVLSVAMVIMTVPLGLWADRHGRVRALQWGNVSFVAGAVVFVVARHYWQFLLSDLLYGVGFAWQSGADTALLAPGGTLWFARYQAASAIAGVVSSLLAGAVLQARGMHVLVILNLMMAVAALLSVVTLREQPPTILRGTSTGRPWAHAGQALQTLRRAPWIVAWSIAAAIGFRLVAINLFFLDLPLWVDRGWHGIWLGLGVAVLYAAGWAGLLVPAMAARMGKLNTLILAQVGMGGLLMMLPRYGSPVVVMLIMGSALALQSWQGPLVNAAITTAVPDRVRVTVLSLLDLPALGVAVIGEVGVGLLADVHLSWAIVASGGLVMAAIPLWWVRPRSKSGRGDGSEPKTAQA